MQTLISQIFSHKTRHLVKLVIFFLFHNTHWLRTHDHYFPKCWSIWFEHSHSATFIQKDISKNNSAGYLIPDGALWPFRYRQYWYINNLPRVNCKPIPVMRAGFSLCSISTGKTLFSLQGSQLMKTGFSLCGNTTQGKTLFWPCTGPVFRYRHVSFCNTYTTTRYLPRFFDHIRH